MEITLSLKRWNYFPRLKSNVQNNCCSFKASYFPITTNSINENAIFSQSRGAVYFQQEYNFTKNELIFRSKDRTIGFRYFIIRISRLSHYISTEVPLLLQHHRLFLLPLIRSKGIRFPIYPRRSSFLKFKITNNNERLIYKYLYFLNFCLQNRFNFQSWGRLVDAHIGA